MILGISIPSIKFSQCQTSYRLCLKRSSCDDIRHIYNETSRNINIQYDNYKSTREVIKEVRKNTENRIISNLTTQKLVLKSIWDMSDNKFNVTWKSALINLPRNIYNFTVRYLNNTLANATNCFIWKTKSSPFCHYCSNRQTLGHVVGGCQTFLQEKTSTWRHYSVLQNIASSIPRDNLTELFVDLVGFQSPSIITGDQKRPDLIIRKNDILWILELSVGFETNIEKKRLNKENLKR